MSLFILTVLIFGVSILAMAIGVAFGRAPLGAGCASANGCEGCGRACETHAHGSES